VDGYREARKSLCKGETGSEGKGDLLRQKEKKSLGIVPGKRYLHFQTPAKTT